MVLTTLSSGFIVVLWLQAMALLLHLQNRQRQRQQQFTRRLFRHHTNPLDCLSDKKIIRYYRFDREGIYTLCDELREDLEKSTKRSRSLQIMIALRYYASGSYMNVIGDAHGVSKMSVSRCINIVSKCITNNIVHRRKTTSYVWFLWHKRISFGTRDSRWNFNPHQGAICRRTLVRM